MNGYKNRMSWTPRIMAAIEEKHRQGVSLKAIARALGCSYESLISARRRAEEIKCPAMFQAEALARIANAGLLPCQR